VARLPIDIRPHSSESIKSRTIEAKKPIDLPISLSLSLSLSLPHPLSLIGGINDRGDLDSGQVQLHSGKLPNRDRVRGWR